MCTSNNINKSHLDTLPKVFSNTSNHHVFSVNPNYNAIFEFTNDGVTRVRGGVRSREQLEGGFMVCK